MNSRQVAKPSLLELGQGRLGGQVLGRGGPEDLPLDRVLQEEGRPVGGRAEHLAQLRPPVAPHDHALATRMLLVGQARVFAQLPHLAETDDVGLRHDSEAPRQEEGPPSGPSPNLCADAGGVGGSPEACPVYQGRPRASTCEGGAFPVFVRWALPVPRPDPGGIEIDGVEIPRRDVKIRIWTALPATSGNPRFSAGGT